jgi:hypothetical protein
MNALLAMAARHLSIIKPDVPRYHEAAMVLLAKSCEEFRSVLDLELTVENRDAALGTCILIHYLCWCDLGFLEGQQRNLDGTYRRLDLSQDRLFLLSEGVRHVRYMSWQLPDPSGSIFWRLIHQRKCVMLRDSLAERGIEYGHLRSKIIDLYDDPRFHGKGPNLSSPTTPEDETAASAPPSPSPSIRELCQQQGQLPIWALPCAHMFSDAHILSIIALRVPADDDQSEIEKELYKRLSFEIVADRIALMIHITLLQEAETLEGAPKVLDYSDPQLRAEVERCFLSFPLLTYRPFNDLISQGDSRALVVLYFFYRGIRTVTLKLRNSWWAEKRAVVMEGILRHELQTRGIYDILREMNLGPMD